MNFLDYDRIEDTLFYFDSNTTLNFVVQLSRKDKLGGRRHIHYETEYGSSYNGYDVGHSIKRSMFFYFVIKDKNDFTNGFLLKQQDVYMITRVIEEQLLPYIIGKKRAFNIIDNQLELNGEYSPVVYATTETKFLAMSPIVLRYDNNQSKEGVRITLNADGNYFDLPIDNFLQFYYILKNTDMYGTAATLINYVKLPPYGLNVYKKTGLGGGVPEPDMSPKSAENNKRGNSFLDSK